MSVFSKFTLPSARCCGLQLILPAQWGYSFLLVPVCQCSGEELPSLETPRAAPQSGECRPCRPVPYPTAFKQKGMVSQRNVKVSLSKTHLYLPPGIFFKVLENISFSNLEARSPSYEFSEANDTFKQEGRKGITGEQRINMKLSILLEVQGKALRNGSRLSGSYSKFSSNSSSLLLQSLL